MSPRTTTDSCTSFGSTANAHATAADLAQGTRGAPATRFVKAVTELQDVLGDSDAVVALGQLRRLARIAASRGPAFIASQLTESEKQRKLQARHDLPAVWKRVKRRGKSIW
jgi:hypothetical protein